MEGGTRGAAPACRDGVGFGAKRLEGPPGHERPVSDHGSVPRSRRAVSSCGIPGLAGICRQGFISFGVIRPRKITSNYGVAIMLDV